MEALRRHRCNGLLANPDRNRNRPTNWSQRHQLVLYMHIEGRRTKDIADALGYHPARVSAIIHSPLFEAKKADLLRETSHEALLEGIRREAIPNLEFLVGLRDDPARHGGDVRVRLRAAKAIAEQVDRVLPKRQGEAEDHTIQINFDETTLARLAQAMAEAKGEAAPGMADDFEGMPPDTRLVENCINELKGRSQAQYPDMRRRGLCDPLLVVTDGAPGLIRAQSVRLLRPRPLRSPALAKLPGSRDRQQQYDGEKEAE